MFTRLKRQKPFTKALLKPSLVFILLASFLGGLGLTSCSQAPQSQPPVHSSIYVFGTIVNLSIFQSDATVARQAIREVETQFQQFHKEWHAWEKGGIVSKINHAIYHQQSIEVAPSVKAFILKSQRLSQQSQGLFDPAIGGLIRLWGFHQEEWQGPPPSQQQIQQWLAAAPSISQLSFAGNQLTSSNPNVQLDFGGNAKGLAIDIAMQTLQANGIQHALVSIGGDMKVMGSKNQVTEDSVAHWSIGIQSPKNPENAIAKVHLQSDESIVTSGDYQRFFEWQGQRYSHIINPITGYPANTFSSVTVIHHDATTADAAATALLIAGPEKWQSIAASMGIDYVFCITHDGEFLQTSAMQKRVQILR